MQSFKSHIYKICPTVINLTSPGHSPALWEDALSLLITSPSAISACALCIGDSGYYMGVVKVVAGQREGLIGCHVVALRGEQYMPVGKQKKTKSLINTYMFTSFATIKPNYH